MKRRAVRGTRRRSSLPVGQSVGTRGKVALPVGQAVGTRGRESLPAVRRAGRAGERLSRWGKRSGRAGERLSRWGKRSGRAGRASLPMEQAVGTGGSVALPPVQRVVPLGRRSAGPYGRLRGGSDQRLSWRYEALDGRDGVSPGGTTRWTARKTTTRPTPIRGKDLLPPRHTRERMTPARAEPGHRRRRPRPVAHERAALFTTNPFEERWLAIQKRLLGHAYQESGRVLALVDDRALPNLARVMAPPPPRPRGLPRAPPGRGPRHAGRSLGVRLRRAPPPCFPYYGLRAASLARDRAPARSSRGQPGRSNEQAGQPPRAAPFVRDPVARDGVRHPDDPGALGAPGREHDDDLHARAEPRRARGAEPVRRDAATAPVTAK